MAATSRAADRNASGDRSTALLEVRLLGGFDVTLGGELVQGFESQNVRALIAYLAGHAGRELSRSQLAGILWPEADEPTARRNLRQALYNLRTALSRAGCSESPIVTSHRTLRLDPKLVELDVLLFSQALRQGRSDGTIDPTFLARAAQAYRGDFLAGFYMRDSPTFEEWMLAEQERLREEAVAALRDLVTVHTEAGTFPLALQYGRQLLRIEPFSEEIHRRILYLYAASGRRSRALAHYDEMCRLFERELGVEPLPETYALYRQIQDQTLTPPTDLDKAEATGPLIPLVGREAAKKSLHSAWAGVLRGAGRLTLVEGELGVGKTRLVRTFLHEATRANPATILQGRSYELAAPAAYQPFVEALGNAVANDVDIADRVLMGAGTSALQALRALIPQLTELEPKLLGQQAERGPREQAVLFSAVARVLEVLSTPTGPGREAHPVVLFLDDLHWADPGSFDLLDSLLPFLPGRAVWIIAAYRTSDLPDPRLLPKLRSAAAALSGGSRIELDRLDEQDLTEIAASLVSAEQAPQLSSLLATRSDGLPLAAVEFVNLLWDEGALEHQASGQWSLIASADELSQLGADEVEATILQRVNRLPTSTRRLLTLASVVGQKFEAELLQLAEHEHDLVVETGLEVMIDHWMVRQFARYWADTRLDRDLALWATGGRKGTFEFTHKSIRSAVYNNLHPARARALHQLVAKAIEQIHASDLTAVCEPLAYHYCRGGERLKALEYFEIAAEKSDRLHAPNTARFFYDQALSVLTEIDDSDPKRVEELQRRVAALA